MNEFDAKGELEFTDNDGFIELRTNAGRLYFSLAQALECTKDEKEGANRRWRLSTRQYWYRLQRTPKKDDQALIRWEYVSPLHPLLLATCTD